MQFILSSYHHHHHEHEVLWCVLLITQLSFLRGHFHLCMTKKWPRSIYQLLSLTLALITPIDTITYLLNDQCDCGRPTDERHKSLQLRAAIWDTVALETTIGTRTEIGMVVLPYCCALPIDRAHNNNNNATEISKHVWWALSEATLSSMVTDNEHIVLQYSYISQINR